MNDYSNMRIVYVDGGGNHVILAPADCDLTLDEIAAKDVPAGVPYQIVDAADLPPTPQEPQPKSPITVALSKLSITDGVIEGFTVDSALSGGFPVDVGKFMMFFAAPQPDVNYIVNVFDGGLFRCYVQPEDYAEDYFTVTTTTLSGEPSDPACLSIIIMRAE